MGQQPPLSQLINNFKMKETKMKKFISIIALLSLFVIGCSEQASITSPNESSASEPNWVSMPKTNGIQINSEWTTTKRINGAQGGFLSNNVSFNGGLFGTVSIAARIDFPQGSFPGNENINMTLSSQNTSVKFGPSKTFNKIAIFNITYTGLDLTGVDPSRVEFAYIANDGSVQYSDHEGIIIDKEKGILKVANAQIPHFSRYGFINKSY